MKQLNLISLAELEKLNATELGNIRGGISNSLTIDKDSSEDSKDHDSDNNDHFKKNDTY